MKLLVIILTAGSLLPWPTASQDATAYSTVVSAINAFAVDFYKVAGKEPGNLVVSPVSVSVELSLLLMGARGQTAQQLANALHLAPGPQRVADGYQQLMDILQSNDSDLLLRMANRLYLQTGFEVNESFNETAVQSFRSDVEELNFRNDAELARVAINDWVAQYTQGKITDLFAQGSLGSDTVLVLVNAVYLKAAWQNVFQKELTTIEPFYTSQSEQKDVSMMHGSFRLGYANVPELNATALRLPYRDSQNRAEMIIVLPNFIDGLETLESGLGDFDISNLEFMTRQVHVTLPRFTISSTIQMNQDLQEMGVTDVFAQGANLSGISDEPLSVSQVIQKAYIKVDENGTEAAAATGIGISITAVPLPATFQANHPFVFLLRIEDITVFMGRVIEPTEEPAE